MPDENLYFYNFIYAVCIFIFTAVSIALVFYFIKKNKRAASVWVLIVSAALDLFFFAGQIIPQVTLENKTLIPFVDRAYKVSLPEFRLEKVNGEARFRYFAAAVYNTLAAFDANTFDILLPQGFIRSNPAEMLDKIRRGAYPLSNYLKSGNILSFLILANTDYPKWAAFDKKAYLDFYSILLADILLQSNYYVVHLVPEADIQKIRQGIEKAYKQIDQAFVPQELLSAVSVTQELILKSAQQKEIYKYLYLNLSAKDYFLNLWQRYRLDNVSTFVRLKYFSRMADIYMVSLARSDLNATYDKIRQDAGITAAVIRFFESLDLKDAEEYLKGLSQGIIGPDSDLSGFSYQIEAYGPNYLKFNCSAPKNGYIYFSDGYDQYWQAKIDGKETKVLRANACFKALKVQAGKHKVEFIYNPLFYRFSLWIYYITVLACVVFLIFKRP
ncbi:MAG: YfhO family protein [Candidatus Omnitrophica bacterium]|jgi:hypothetical protein|nr:YfhO family protein [Candidatus Omnitrophota bacterium]